MSTSQAIPAVLLSTIFTTAIASSFVLAADVAPESVDAMDAIERAIELGTKLSWGAIVVLLFAGLAVFFWFLLRKLDAGVSRHFAFIDESTRSMRSNAESATKTTIAIEQMATLTAKLDDKLDSLVAATQSTEKSWENMKIVLLEHAARNDGRMEEVKECLKALANRAS